MVMNRKEIENRVF